MVKKCKTILAVTLAGALTIGSVTTGSAGSQAAAKVRLSQKTLTLKVGQKKKLTLKKASGKITWKSSKKTVATVSSKGMVTAKKEGTATITATNKKKKYTCKVTVKKTDSFKAKEVMFYMTSETSAPANLYFRNGGDIPYINLEDDGISFIAAQAAAHFPGFDLKYDVNGDLFIITRESGYFAVIDFAQEKMYYWDVDEFYRAGNKSDLLGTFSFKGSHEELFRKSDSTIERHGESIEIDFKKYGIPIGTDGGKHFIPLQTFNDLFLTRFFKHALVYNGEGLFIRNSSFSGDILDKYNSAPKQKMSSEFIEFNYNELCMELDHLYGLKDAHGIKDFDSFFVNSGFFLDMLQKEDNATMVDWALDKMCTQYFDDGHSGFSKNSTSYNSNYNDYPALKRGPAAEQMYVLSEKMEAAVSKYYPDGAKCYEEVGDTAYIKFDSFTNPTGFPDYKTAPTAEEIDGATPETVNTIRLMQYAYDQITAHKDTIKRVVLDLSMNHGGVAEAALYVVGAFLGKGMMAVKNTLTGATENNVYEIDLNRDGIFDEKDSMRAANKDLKLYCLTSGLSFSCGNYVPCIFKDSKEVGLIGQTTGGGSCIVSSASTASGAFFRVSGPKQISFTKNGSFYDADRGADPDYYMYDLTKLPDRKYMNTVLDKLD